MTVCYFLDNMITNSCLQFLRIHRWSSKVSVSQALHTIRSLRNINLPAFSRSITNVITWTTPTTLWKSLLADRSNSFLLTGRVVNRARTSTVVPTCEEITVGLRSINEHNFRFEEINSHFDGFWYEWGIQGAEKYSAPICEGCCISVFDTVILTTVSIEKKHNLLAANTMLDQRKTEILTVNQYTTSAVPPWAQLLSSR